MADKIPIELTPYEALAILALLNKASKHYPHLLAVGKRYEHEVYSKITDDQITDAQAETEVQFLLGRLTIQQ